MPYIEYDEVQAACTDCGRLFPSDEALAAHRTDAHGGIVRAAPALGAKRVVCSVCHARFRSTAALSTHNRAEHTS